jgi:hypothetical protein
LQIANCNIEGGRSRIDFSGKSFDRACRFAPHQFVDRRGDLRLDRADLLADLVRCTGQRADKVFSSAPALQCAIESLRVVTERELFDLPAAFGELGLGILQSLGVGFELRALGQQLALKLCARNGFLK